MQHIISFWQAVTDLVVANWKVLVVTWIQEVWRFCTRVVTVFVAILLGFLNKPAFEEWWQAHRSGRIHKRETKEFADSDLSDAPTGLGFESLLDEPTIKSAPASPYSRRRKSRYTIEKDKTKNSVFEYEKVSTGLFEDIQEWSFILIDKTSEWFQKQTSNIFECLKKIRIRKVIFSLCGLGLSFYIKMVMWFFSFMWTGGATVWWTLKVAIRMPSKLRYAKEQFEMNERARFDVRDRKDILDRLGYPYQEFEVITEDGYILQLERLPRPGSHKAVYFQHGVLDSAHAWLGGLQDGTDSTAFRAYEMGYDVWAGTLRGCGWDRKHSNPNISNGHFWDFTVNEHAFKDIPAFIQFIEKTKNSELEGVSMSAHVPPPDSRDASRSPFKRSPSEPPPRRKSSAPSSMPLTRTVSSDLQDSWGLRKRSDSTRNLQNSDQRPDSPHVLPQPEPSSSLQKSNSFRSLHSSSNRNSQKPDSTQTLSRHNSSQTLHSNSNKNLQKSDSNRTLHHSDSTRTLRHSDSTRTLRHSDSTRTLRRPSQETKPLKKQKAYKLTIVAHSMGAMATLMYTVYWRLKGLDHGLDAMVLLAPAGLHKTAPTFCKVTGPFLSWFFATFPNVIHSFHFPSEIGRLLVAKMVEDVKHNYSLRNFLSFMTYKFLGGEKTEHAITQVHNLAYNVFAGTSVGIFKHFWQNWLSGGFFTFDYGLQKNLQVYGTIGPVDILANFDKIDIPTFFVIGIRDSLIEPVSILKQYETLSNAHPELAHVRAFPRMGHIDVTLGENSVLTNYLINTMEAINSDMSCADRIC